MRASVNEEVSVIMVFSASQKLARPHLVSWQNKDYKVGKIGFHHTVRQGKTQHHIFELTDSDQSLWLRLNLDTSNLHWTLEEVSDGLPE
jgi:hypothetical protein